MDGVEISISTKQSQQVIMIHPLGNVDTHSSNAAAPDIVLLIRGLCTRNEAIQKP